MHCILLLCQVGFMWSHQVFNSKSHSYDNNYNITCSHQNVVSVGTIFVIKCFAEVSIIVSTKEFTCTFLYRHLLSALSPFWYKQTQRVEVIASLWAFLMTVCRRYCNINLWKGEEIKTD